MNTHAQPRRPKNPQYNTFSVLEEEVPTEHASSAADVQHRLFQAMRYHKDALRNTVVTIGTTVKSNYLTAEKFFQSKCWGSLQRNIKKMASS